MSELRSRFALRRLLIESATIVSSILLAFAVDAWWDARTEARRERELLSGLLADFEASRDDLESRLDLARRMARGNQAFLDLVAGEELPGQVVVPDTLILAVLGGPTYEPVTNTLDAALASGETELVQSREVRATLANWRRLLLDAGEDEREVRRITNDRVVPILSEDLDLDPYFRALLAWSGGDPHGAGRLIAAQSGASVEGATPVRVTSVLVGALSVRRFYVEFSAADLEDLLGSLDQAVALLEEEGARPGASG